MSSTLLELVVAIILVVVLWQIGLIVAPSIIRWFSRLGREVDQAADQALNESDQDMSYPNNTKEHTNGTRH